MGFEEVGVGLELVEECGAVAEEFEEAEVVGDLREARVEVQVGGGELGHEREAGAGGSAGEQRGEDDAGALVAGGEEDGVALAAEGLGAAEGVGRGEEFAERGRRGDEGFEAGVVAEDFEGEAAGGGGDARAGDGRVDGGDEGRGVDGRAEGEGVLQEEEVADVGEVGLAGVEHALEDGEVDRGPRI